MTISNLERYNGIRKRNTTAEEKEHYRVDVDDIAAGRDTRTTVMIKNIPNKYSQKLLLETIDKCHRGNYDFLYLPIDFRNRCNVGYAFVNFKRHDLIIPFYKEFNGKKWNKFNSEKICSIAYGRVQGLHALVDHFKTSSVMSQLDARLKPVILLS